MNRAYLITDRAFAVVLVSTLAVALASACNEKPTTKTPKPPAPIVGSVAGDQAQPNRDALSSEAPTNDAPTGDAPTGDAPISIAPTESPPTSTTESPPELSVADAVAQARALLLEKRAADARPLAEGATKRAAHWSSAWNTLGRVELMEGKLAAAEKAFLEATKCNDGNHYAWNNLGLTRLRQRNFAGAVTALEKATSDAEAAKGYMFNNLGRAYEKTARTDEALVAYKAGLARGSGLAGVSFVRLEKVREAKVVASSDDSSGAKASSVSPDADATEAPVQTIE